MSILHIALADEWRAALSSGEYPWSSRGVTLESEGFVHCSTADQVAGVAQAFYADESGALAVLVLDEDAIVASGVDVRYERASDGESFPHIYGSIRPEWVTDVRPARFVGGAFVY